MPESLPTQHSAAASAPGKVLLAGGFLVLDRKHRGLVFGLDARIHVVSTASFETGSEGGANGHEKIVRVKSPQFEEAEWVYGVSVTEQVIDVKQVEKYVFSVFHFTVGLGS